MKIQPYCVDFDSKRLSRQYFDFIIVGGGIAGLYAAYLAKQHGSVALLNKGDFDGSDAYRAQGGIACVWDKQDSFQSHIADTLATGDGLCDDENVAIMVKEAPEHIKQLMSLGVPFDKEGDRYALGMEGAHSHCRIFHSGDYTGKAIISSIAHAMDGVKLYRQYIALDLLTDNDACYGILAMDLNSGKKFIMEGDAVILAGGGVGNLFVNTTNSPLVTGDTIAMAYRKGCALTDMEFMQFHPTALYDENGQRFLISEAVRGEGGILRDIRGQRFMEKYHPLKELAPRDIVARAIYAEMQAHSSHYIYLDVTNIEKEYFANRFPTIYAKCIEMGIDISKDYIPVSPAAHFLMGGIKTNSYGQTDVANLYACGECACTHVHGANRLASNSLLEAIVFSARAIKHAVTQTHKISKPKRFAWQCDNMFSEDLSPDTVSSMRTDLQYIMEQHVGICRCQTGLQKAFDWIEEHSYILRWPAERLDIYELQSLIVVGYSMTKAALLREESRGSHYRTDYPYKDDNLKHHIIIKGEDVYFDR